MLRCGVGAVAGKYAWMRMSKVCREGGAGGEIVVACLYTRGSE